MTRLIATPGYLAPKKMTSTALALSSWKSCVEEEIWTTHNLKIMLKVIMCSQIMLKVVMSI